MPWAGVARCPGYAGMLPTACLPASWHSPQKTLYTLVAFTPRLACAVWAGNSRATGQVGEALIPWRKRGAQRRYERTALPGKRHRQGVWAFPTDAQP